MAIFNSYVSLPEGRHMVQKPSKSLGEKKLSGSTNRIWTECDGFMKSSMWRWVKSPSTWCKRWDCAQVFDPRSAWNTSKGHCSNVPWAPSIGRTPTHRMLCPHRLLQNTPPSSFWSFRALAVSHQYPPNKRSGLRWFQCTRLSCNIF